MIKVFILFLSCNIFAFINEEESNKVMQFFWNDKNSIINIDTHYYIRNLAQKIIKNNYDFFIIDDNKINAFATKYGLIGINSGLINLTASESELAAVLAHEIAHIKLKHFTRFENKNKNNTLLAISSILLASLAKNKELSQAILSSGIATSSQLKINFTRDHEIEADNYGKILLKKSIFNDFAMSNFFNKLKDDKNALEFLRTHPLSKNRVANTTSIGISHNANNKKHKNSFEYLILKSKFNQESDFLLQNKDLKNYIDALGYFNKNKYQKTINQLTNINNNAVNLLKGRAFSHMKRLNKALQFLTGESALHKYYQAQAYFLNNNYKKALMIIKKQNYKKSSVYNYKLIAKINFAQERLDKYHYNQGLSFLLMGSIKKAKEQFVLAKNITQNQDLFDILQYKIITLDDKN